MYWKIRFNVFKLCFLLSQIHTDSEVQNLRSQLSRKQNEISSLQTSLNASSSRAGEVEGAKVAVSAELQKAKETAKVII